MFSSAWDKSTFERKLPHRLAANRWDSSVRQNIHLLFGFDQSLIVYIVFLHASFTVGKRDVLQQRLWRFMAFRFQALVFRVLFVKTFINSFTTLRRCGF